jgi:hypothetical protein
MTDTTQLTVDIDASFAGTGVIPSVEIDRIIALRNDAVTRFISSMAELENVRQLIKSASGLEHAYGFDAVVSSSLNQQTNPERVLRSITRFTDQKIWKRLMTDTGMYTFMSTKQRDEWEKQLESDACPAIALDNVMATFRHLHESKAETFETGVIDVFRALSWDYKTNNACRLGKKIIISGFLDTWRSGRPTFSASGQTRLDDLARPFWLLDGKNVPDHRQSEGRIFDDFYRINGAGELCDMEYFTVRAYLKGTGHITFKRPDLVDKLNDIVARHYPSALPPQV